MNKRFFIIERSNGEIIDNIESREVIVYDKKLDCRFPVSFQRHITDGVWSSWYAFECTVGMYIGYIYKEEKSFGEFRKVLNKIGDQLIKMGSKDICLYTIMKRNFDYKYESKDMTIQKFVEICKEKV